MSTASWKISAAAMVNPRLIVLSVLVSLVCVIPSFSFASADVTKTILDNGMTVLTRPMPGSPIVSIYAYVKTGSATEGKFSGTGISHFVEHMLFKGTAKRPVGAIAREVKALGGTINAHTSFDRTFYTLDVPAGNFSQGLDILSDMLMHSVFDLAEVEKERQVVHGEMRLRNDRPDSRLAENVFRTVYIRHPYRHPIIGYEQLFDGITRGQLFEYYQTHYIPNNIIFSVAGDIDEPAAIEAIRSAFAAFKPLPYPDRLTPAEPPQTTPRYFEEYYATPLYRFSLAFPSTAMTDADTYALDVLSMALGQGESSRLHIELFKKRRLVQEIRSSNYTPEDKGFFEIEGVMEKDRLGDVRAAVFAIIKGIQVQGLLPDELEKTKRQVLSQFIFSNQTSSSLAFQAASDEAVAGDPVFSRRYVEAVKRVSNDDIKRVAERYLREDIVNVTVLKPKSAKPKGSSQTSGKSLGEIQKVVLPNGLTVLLKEDHSVGLAAVNVVAQGGLRLENEKTNGISHLLSAVWPKGTTQKTDAWIAREMERRGGSIGGYAGRNSIGLGAQVLSEDTSFALGLLAELIQQPAFDPKVIAQEKERMLVDIDQRDEDIRAFTLKNSMAQVYTTHPFRRDLLGSKESVGNITRADLLAYYNRLIVPGNLVVSIFGDINSAKVLEEVKRHLGGLKSGTVSIGSFQEPKITAVREKTAALDKEQAMVMFAFLAPALKDDGRWSMYVLDEVLGSGLSGRLFTKVRDELGKAYTVGSSYIPGLDTGTFLLFVLTTPDKVDTVKSIIRKELDDLSRNGISDRELSESKASAKGGFTMGLLTNQDQGFRSAIDELYGLGYNAYTQFAAHIDALNTEDIKQAAAAYLNSNHAAITVTQRP